MDAVQAGQLRAPGHADGTRAGRLRALPQAPQARSPRTPNGSIATGSCCRCGHCLDAPLLSAPSERLRRVSDDDIRNFRQWGAPTAGPSRVRARPWRRDDDRTARPRRRERAWAWQWPSAGSPQRYNRDPVTTGRRPFHLRSSSVRTATSWRASPTRPAALAGHQTVGEAHLDLRRQPDHDRRRHRPLDLDRSGEALRGVRVARHTGRRRKRSRGDPPGSRGVEGGDRTSVARHPAHHDRLREPGQGGDVGVARGPARRRGDRGDQAQPRVPLREPFWVDPGARATGWEPGSGGGCSCRVVGTLRGLQGGVSRGGGRVGTDLVGGPAGRVGRGCPGPLGHGGCGRDEGLVRQGHPGAREPHAQPGRWLRRSGRVEQDDHFRRGRPAARLARRQERALRHPGARHGVDHERDDATRRHPAVRRHVSDLLRLHASGDSFGRADGAAGHVRLLPRFDRTRGRRSYAPACRADDDVAGHSRTDGPPARGRPRDGASVAGGDGADRRTVLPGAEPPDRAGAAEGAAGTAVVRRRLAAWRVRARGGRRRFARGDRDRERVRGSRSRSMPGSGFRKMAFRPGS